MSSLLAAAWCEYELLVNLPKCLECWHCYAGPDAEVVELLPGKMKPSKTFVQNWNQHTSFHRRKRVAEGEVSGDGGGDSPGSSAESPESSSLDSKADQRQDSSREAGKRRASPFATVKLQNGGGRAAGHSSKSQKVRTGG